MFYLTKKKQNKKKKFWNMRLESKQSKPTTHLKYFFHPKLYFSVKCKK